MCPICAKKLGLLSICNLATAGNDGIVLKDKSLVTDLKGLNVNLVELSVSNNLLERAFESEGVSEKDLTVLNTSDADMVAIYGTDDVTAVST